MDNRDYLREAQEIGNGISLLLAERAHVVALIQWDKEVAAQLVDLRSTQRTLTTALARLLKSHEGLIHEYFNEGGWATSSGNRDDADDFIAKDATMIAARAALALVERGEEGQQ